MLSLVSHLVSFHLTLFIRYFTAGGGKSDSSAKNYEQARTSDAIVDFASKLAEDEVQTIP